MGEPDGQVEIVEAKLAARSLTAYREWACTIECVDFGFQGFSLQGAAAICECPSIGKYFTDQAVEEKGPRRRQPGRPLFI
jgi:hypothetical protein